MMIIYALSVRKKIFNELKLAIFKQDVIKQWGTVIENVSKMI